MVARFSLQWLRVAVVGSAAALIAISDVQGKEPPAGFVPPPRSISDITAILDQERPDPEKIGKLRSEADATIPSGLAPDRLFTELERRAIARGLLGRTRDAMADLRQAIAVGKGKVVSATFARARMALISRYRQVGDYKAALDQGVLLAREVDRPGSRGWLFAAYQTTVQTLLSLGDLTQAETYLRRSEALLRNSRSWDGFPVFGANWEAQVNLARARIYQAKGQYLEAEAAYRSAEAGKREHVRRVTRTPSISARTSDLREQDEQGDTMLALQGRMKALQGRMAEAEVDVRRALLSRLNAVGKQHPGTSWFIEQLAWVLAEQGRYREAESLFRVSLQVKRALGVPEESGQFAYSLNQLARLLRVQGRYKEAGAVFAQVDAAIKAWPAKLRERLETNTNRVYQSYATGQVDAGVKMAAALLVRSRTQFGDKHTNTVLARGVLAVGLARAGRDEDARREFKEVVPLLLNDLRVNAEDENDVAAADRQRGRQFIAEAYFTLVARTRPDAREIDETFRLADLVRAQSVHRALAASSARLLTRDPRVAEQVRREQDIEKQISAQTVLLGNVLTLPGSERDEKVVRELTAQIKALRLTHEALRKALRQNFPGYADLVDPRPPSIEDVRKVLQPDEALLSFYLGRQKSFLWVLRKEGAASLTSIDAGNAEIDRIVHRLREGFEATAAAVHELPPFDVQLSHQLYRRLVQSTEDKWRSAGNLIVVTNGALGRLPLAVLTTEPAPATSTSAIFEGYRSVPWLGRTHAITSMPSAAALRTLRLLPVGRGATESFVGFGDPLFSAAQAEPARAEDAPVTVADASIRGTLRRRAAPETLGVDSADLARLPRLPDTADELRSIAQALKTDPAKGLYLRKDANEKNVKEIELSRYRVIAFATHGLVPGELNGLSQPALALTAPDVAGVSGDGLLTMEEVLALKLNADWVVLSACNTATGAGAGAEAVTGLGRAFFYAGARTLLVTNWSVFSEPAATLVTDIFRRQTADPQLTRAQALRQAMMGLMDGPGYIDPEINTEITYAHPIFWAPYTIVGDGGSP